jgi:hypothetical protein
MIVDSVDIEFLLDLVAKANIGDGHCKKHYGDDQIDCIDH